MAAFIEVDAVVEGVKSGRVYVNLGPGARGDIVLSFRADRVKVTGGAQFQAGQAVRVQVEGNRILKIEPWQPGLSR